MAELKRFYVRDMDDWKKTLSLGKFSDKELDIKVVERGIVLPVRPISSITPKYEGGVCDSNFNFVAGFNKTDPELLSGGG